MQQLWYKDAVFYQVYVRAFCDSNGDGHGDFPGLTSKLDYFTELGVECLWIMPMYQSPLADDGYDISDFYKIHPDYGTLDDFKTFLDEAHKRGLKVITDLVLNHTSDQHPWFQAARADLNSPYRDYYVWSDTGDKYKDVRIIFVDVELSNWSYDEVAGQYFWHRFYRTQPDLNWDNPAVKDEMFDVVRYWLAMGVDGFRADAVPYLIEREGTSCENLPETHAILKDLRAMLDREYAEAILLCEANMWPEDVRPYFGEGDEFHMGFHFPIMPRIFMALKKGDVTDMVEIINRTPEIPANCQWVTFLRNHDELTLEMVTEADRQWMWAQYAPNPRMRFNLGIRRRLAPLLDNDHRKIELAKSLLFTLPGSPIIYFGDEIGMGENIWLDDRNGVRTPMQWDATPEGGFSDAPQERWYSPNIERPPYSPGEINVADAKKDPASLFNALAQMIAIRKQHPTFGRGAFQWVTCSTTAVAAFTRTYEGKIILSVNNLTDQPQTPVITLENAISGVGLIFGAAIPTLKGGKKLEVKLPPYGYGWILLGG